MTAPNIDLDAAVREATYPDGIPVTKGGKTFTLPAELPEAVLDPLLSDDLDIAGVIADVLKDTRPGEDRSIGDDVVAVLTARPNLPKDAVLAAKECFAVLFGDQFEDFCAERPSINDYIRIARAALPLYGVSLGEAFGSPGPSEPAGETPKPTSPVSTPDSTPETSGETPTEVAT